MQGAWRQLRNLRAAGAAFLALGGCDSTPPRLPAQAVRTLALPVRASLVLPERFTALGTEPFWAAKVAGGVLVYSTPSDEAGRTVAITRHSGPGPATVEGIFDGKPLRLRVTAGPCSDGMSDAVYPYTVERDLGDAVEHGCARRD